MACSISALKVGFPRDLDSAKKIDLVSFERSLFTRLFPRAKWVQKVFTHNRGFVQKMEPNPASVSTRKSPPKKLISFESILEWGFHETWNRPEKNPELVSFETSHFYLLLLRAKWVHIVFTHNPGSVEKSGAKPCWCSHEKVSPKKCGLIWVHAWFQGKPSGLKMWTHAKPWSHFWGRSRLMFPRDPGNVDPFEPITGLIWVQAHVVDPFETNGGLIVYSFIVEIGGIYMHGVTLTKD